MQRLSKLAKLSVLGSLIILYMLAACLSQTSFSESSGAASQETTRASPTSQSRPTHVGFVVTLPQRAYMNSMVTVSVETQPGTNCDLTYINPAGVVSEADGLGSTIAEADGMCTWSWKLEETTQSGPGRIIIYVGEVSETHFMEIRSNK